MGYADRMSFKKQGDFWERIFYATLNLFLGLTFIIWCPIFFMLLGYKDKKFPWLD